MTGWLGLPVCYGRPGLPIALPYIYMIYDTYRRKYFNEPKRLRRDLQLKLVMIRGQGL
jgi:hypothetical protein